MYFLFGVGKFKFGVIV